MSKEELKPLPMPAAAGPCPNDQINHTDEQCRAIPVANGGFERGYKAQGVVLARRTEVTNDTHQVTLMLEKSQAIPARGREPTCEVDPRLRPSN